MSVEQKPHSEFAVVRDALSWAMDEHDFNGTENPIAYVVEARLALTRIEEQLEAERLNARQHELRMIVAQDARIEMQKELDALRQFAPRFPWKTGATVWSKEDVTWALESGAIDLVGLLNALAGSNPASEPQPVPWTNYGSTNVSPWGAQNQESKP